MEQISISNSESYNQSTACWIDYAIVLLLIAATGFEWCFSWVEMIFFGVFPLSVMLYIKRQPQFKPSIIFFFLSFSIWSLCQNTIGQSSVSALINLTIRMLIYYFAVMCIVDFPKILVTIIKWICIVSLVMYVLMLVPPLRDMARSIFHGVKPIAGLSDGLISTNPGQSMIFYFLPKSFGVSNFRNSGPFWEPGMFAVFINIALCLNIIKSRCINKTSYIFILASISTLSSTSAITTISIISYYLLFIRKAKISSIIYLFMVGGAVIVFLESDFGLAKIQHDISSKASYSRFGAIAYHMKLIQKYFWLGRGFNSYGNTLLTSPNGLTVVPLFWGIPVAICYYTLLYRGCKHLCKIYTNESNVKNTVVLFLTFLIVAFSQDVTTRHFYYAVVMYGLNYTSEIYNEEPSLEINK